MARISRPRLFTIAPHDDFLATLAGAMWRGVLPGAGAAPAAAEGDFPAFAGWRIYLPTRRAARALARAMLRFPDVSASMPGDGGAARLLPRILPLGDVDEDELRLAQAADTPMGMGGQGDVSEMAELLEPAIAPLPRLFLLAELMQEWAETDEARQWRLAAHLRAHAGAALRLARSLARLIDSFENEELRLEKVADLWADEPLLPERAEHRLAAVAFLRFLAERYPAALRARGLQGAAARRAALIRQEARFLRDNPPDTPVIAAGSTGSLPATAELLATIARLPTGCVILPGLDIDMDDESWRQLQPGHPQYGMKRLLEKIGVDRSEVRLLSPCPEEAGDRGNARLVLLREAMRPVPTTGSWKELSIREDLQNALRAGTDGLRLLMAPSRRQEALAIALLMRETLEQPGRTCMLVTPDRTLARAVRAELSRWDIAVDDSAGQPLIDTVPGMFLKLLLRAALEDFAPVPLMALLGHPLACAGMPRVECAEAAADLELAVLRPARRLEGLGELARLATQRAEAAQAGRLDGHEHPNVRHMDARRWQRLCDLAAALAQRLEPLAQQFASREKHPVATFLDTLLRVAEEMTSPPGEGSLLWRGEAGEALAQAVAEILLHAGEAPAMPPADVAAFLQVELANRVLRPHQTAQSRLSILGLLEARLLRADRVILGGLNEGIWPEVAQSDPWLNRTDREALGLPVPEQRLGLSAHDFVQAAAGDEVWMTCAERLEQRPSEPSRWILRLQAVLQAAGLDELLRKPQDEWPLQVAAALDSPVDPTTGHQAHEARPVQPPRPAPPLHLRPLRYSASRVRTLLRDPYAIFAHQVLRLEPLDDLMTSPTPALFGTVVHAALEDFTRHWPDALPDDAAERLFKLLCEHHERIIGNAAHLRQVRERLRRMADAWVSQCEIPWRHDGLLRAFAERSGEVAFSAAGRQVRLSARADRLDLLSSGGWRIVDYKTGTLPGRHPVSDDYDPQMDLEAAIALHGGFRLDGAGQGGLTRAERVEELVLARLSGGEPAMQLLELHKPDTRKGGDARDVVRRAEDALRGLAGLLEEYLGNEEQAYLPLDHGQRERRPGDYDHLNRWREWLALLTAREERQPGRGDDPAARRT